MIPMGFPSSRHRFCHVCGRALGSSYTKYSTGLVVCSHCERTAPRCTHCHQPARELTAFDAQQFCNTCLSALPRCGSCQKPISGQFYRFGDSPQPYCPSCAEQKPHCDVCGVPLGKDGQRLAGGQYRCGECSRTLILSEQEAQRVYGLVMQQAQTVLGLTVAETPTLIVAQPAELATVRRTYGDHEPASAEGTNQHVVGFFTQRGPQRVIYVESGLPRASMIGTLAHEYAHAWQADHAPHHQPPHQCEGFAEWVAWRILIALGHTREAARATRREDLYGRGLRYFITLEQQAGRSRVFAEATAPGVRPS